MEMSLLLHPYIPLFNRCVLTFGFGRLATIYVTVKLCCCFFITLVLLVTSVRGQVLRDPGPLCPGQTATIICDISGGTLGSNGVTWSYNGVQVATIVPGVSTLPATRSVSGVEFTLLDTEIEFMFLISFVASDRMSGSTLECVGNGLVSSVTFQVEPATGK